MKINFPKIVRAVDLGAYAPEMSGQLIHVWVNPPSADLVDMGEQYKASFEDKGAEEKYLALLSGVLSQGDKDTHVSVDELREIEKSSGETDPAFWVWLQNRIIETINDHRLGRKKV